MNPNIRPEASATPDVGIAGCRAQRSDAVLLVQGASGCAAFRASWPTNPWEKVVASVVGNGTVAVPWLLDSVTRGCRRMTLAGSLVPGGANNWGCGVATVVGSFSGAIPSPYMRKRTRCAGRTAAAVGDGCAEGSLLYR